MEMMLQTLFLLPLHLASLPPRSLSALSQLLPLLHAVKPGVVRASVPPPRMPDHVSAIANRPHPSGLVRLIHASYASEHLRSSSSFCLLQRRGSSLPSCQTSPSSLRHPTSSTHEDPLQSPDNRWYTSSLISTSHLFQNSFSLLI